MAERGLNTADAAFLQLFTRHTGALLRHQKKRDILPKREEACAKGRRAVAAVMIPMNLKRGVAADDDDHDLMAR